MINLLFLGIIAGLIFSELTDLSPGGIIVPAYFAIYADDWKRILGTVLIAFLCTAFVRLLSGHMILYGRRRYAVYLMSGIAFRFIIGFSGIGTAFFIGYLIPGILGREIERQKPVPTLLSLGIVTAFTRLIYLLIR